MAFEKPAPDLSKIVVAREDWERGEWTDGKTLADVKTAGLDAILCQLTDAGWAPES